VTFTGLSERIFVLNAPKSTARGLTVGFKRVT
jgi:hypothetical protein